MSAPIILCDTAGMTNERWLECRAHGPKGTIPYTVGGSDVAAIFGVSPWTTPLELWMIKKGRMKAPVKSNQEQLMMGHLLEPIAAYWYQEKPAIRFMTTPICISTQITRGLLRTLTAALPVRRTMLPAFWSAKAAPITKPEIGLTMPIPSTMSCSFASIWLWRMWILARFLLLGKQSGT